MNASFRRQFRRSVLIAAITLTACSGGGGDLVLTPFWNQSGIVVADFNGDGRADVAVASAYVDGGPPHAGYVEVYLQLAPGNFGAPVRYPIGPDPWGMSAGDVNGDGHLDLVIATPRTVAPQNNVIADDGGISVLRQDATHLGSFLASQWIATGGAAEDAAIADLDGDTLADLIVADGVKVNGRALLLRQNPGAPGTFLAPTSLLTGSGRGSEDVAVADVNGDGRTDIVLAATDSIVVFYQNTTGSFDPAVILGAGLNPQGVAVADVDGDGRTDIVAANAGNAPAGGTGGSSVTLLLQTNPGVFVSTNVPVADGARRVAIGDLNGDGVPDVGVVSRVYQDLFSPSRVSVLLQSSVNRGQFTVTGVYTGTLPGAFIAIGDITGDNRNDLVLENGPSVLVQSATAPGTFEAVRTLR